MVQVKGVRIDKLTISRESEDVKFSVEYSLVADNGKVLAKQECNTGYNEDLKVQPTADAIVAIRKAADVIKLEIEKTLGIVE